MKNYTIYKISNTVNDKLYIGQTHRSINHRFSEHCKPSRNKLSIITKAICKYGRDKFKIEVLEETLFPVEKEEFYIKKFNTISPNGYNLEIKGSVVIYSQKTLEKIRENIKNRIKLFGPILPKGTKQTKEWIEKRFKNRRKPVIRINPDNSEYEYTSAKKALSDLGKIVKSTSLISAVCLGIRYSAYGYRWKYKNEYHPEQILKGRNKKPVMRIDYLGNKKYYNSCYHAQKDGFDVSTIVKVCKGKLKTHKDFKWIYAPMEITIGK